MKGFVAFLGLLVSVFAWGAAGQQLLMNSAFDQDSLEGWSTFQHSGDKSYEFFAKSGVAEIRRTGAEPWGVLAQRIKLGEQAKVGSKLKLKAEVRGDFIRGKEAPFEPTAVKLVIHGWPADPALRFMGLRDLGEVSHELPLVEEKGAWQSVTLELVVPDNVVDAEVVFVMAYNGALQIRSPRLYIVDAQ